MTPIPTSPCTPHHPHRVLNLAYIYPHSLPWCLKISDSISELINHKVLAAIRYHVLRETFPSTSSSSAFRSLNGNQRREECWKMERPGGNTLAGENISHDLKSAQKISNLSQSEVHLLNQPSWGFEFLIRRKSTKNLPLTYSFIHSSLLMFILYTTYVRS